MTELGFMIDLLLNHKLPKVTRDAVAMRLKDVETALSARAPTPIVAAPKPQVQIPPHLQDQAPSTIAAMMRHSSESTQVSIEPTIELPSIQTPPEPVAVVAQTPAAQAAVASRNAAIAQAVGGKAERGRTSPRKW